MGKIHDLKRQNPNLDVNFIDLISEADPSDSHKYLGFLIKMLKANSSNNNMEILRHIFGEENILALIKFEEHSKAKRIKSNDISLYTSFEQIKEEVRDADELVRIKEMEKQIKILHKDEEWLVMVPLTYESSKLYGNGTAWCTTQKNHWERYVSDYMIIYIINRKNNDKKFAISSRLNSDLVQGWESNDESINPFMIPVPIEILGKIIEVIRLKVSVEDLEEYKLLNGISPSHKKEKYLMFSGEIFNELSEYRIDVSSLPYLGQVEQYFGKING
jgi:hypothetical protein